MRRRIEPLSLALVAVCFAATAPSLLFGRSLHSCGSLTLRDLWTGQVWRLLTSMLLHAGWAHLIVNGISLYCLGAPIARGLGRRALVAFLLIAGLGGHAAGLLLTAPGEPDLERVGISGAVFGLLGLILAAEWAMSGGWRGFFRRPNVWLALFFISLNVLLAFRFPEIDQAAHGGGFLAGLAVGRAWLSRRGVHPLRAALIAALLVAPPLAYAIHPFRSVTFHLVMARETGQASHLEAVLELDPGHPYARSLLAVDRDDPSLLAGMRPPRTAEESFAVQVAVQTLAQRRLIAKPQEALALMRSVPRLPADLWERVGDSLYARGEMALAQEALHEVRHWRAALRSVHAGRLLLEDPALSREAAAPILRRFVEDAREACNVLGEESEGGPALALRAQATLEGAADLAHEWARRMADPPEFAPGLASLYRVLANQAPGRPWLLARAALWEERSPGEEEAAPDRMRAALREARQVGDRETAATAAAWLRERGLPE